MKLTRSQIIQWQHELPVGNPFRLKPSFVPRHRYHDEVGDFAEDVVDFGGDVIEGAVDLVDDVWDGAREEVSEFVVDVAEGIGVDPKTFSTLVGIGLGVFLGPAGLALTSASVGMALGVGGTNLVMTDDPVQALISGGTAYLGGQIFGGAEAAAGGELAAEFGLETGWEGAAAGMANEAGLANLAAGEVVGGGLEAAAYDGLKQVGISGPNPDDVSHLPDYWHPGVEAVNQAPPNAITMGVPRAGEVPAAPVSRPWPVAMEEGFVSGAQAAADAPLYNAGTVPAGTEDVAGAVDVVSGWEGPAAGDGSSGMAPGMEGLPETGTGVLDIHGVRDPAAIAQMPKKPGIINRAVKWAEQHPRLGSAAIYVGGNLVGGAFQAQNQQKLMRQKIQADRELLAQKTQEEIALQEWKRKFIQGGSYWDSNIGMSPGDKILRRPDGVPIYRNGLINVAMNRGSK